MAESFFIEMLAQISERGRALFSRSREPLLLTHQQDIVELCHALLSRRGEASGVAIAGEILDRWESMESEARRDFLLRLAKEFGPSVAEVETAIDNWRRNPGEPTLRMLHSTAEPKRQELIRRLNLAPNGTRRLVTMREELFAHRKEHPELAGLEGDFVHLFSSWFNRGFLVLKRIDWTTSANVLEKIIRYEAVHAISDWAELRRRIAPDDRRLYAFFHPQMIDEPLIFVEVALTRDMPDSIAPLLDTERKPGRAWDATIATFYSISNCQEGLKGVSFGSFLIKQVAEDLKRELPGLKTFVTLSPVPEFAKWLRQEQSSGANWLSFEERQTLSLLEDKSWAFDERRKACLSPLIAIAAAQYFLIGKGNNSKPVDPVARFHLGNGARLERLNPLGDLSQKGLAQSHGLMVNYLYDLPRIESNHETYAETGAVIASKTVRALLRGVSGPVEARNPDRATA